MPAVCVIVYYSFGRFVMIIIVIIIFSSSSIKVIIIISSFVCPQSLKERMVPKIYAVVVLPVRDLAEQVYKVFSQYCAGTGLKVSALSFINMIYYLNTAVHN